MYLFLFHVVQLVTGVNGCNAHKNDPRIVTCAIGFERIRFLVDSGASVNTITPEYWERIKRNCSRVIQDVVLEPEQILKGYACKEPLTLECSFRAYIAVCNGTKTTLTKFYVVKGTNTPLLSYQTSIDLKLLFIKGDISTDETICSKCDLTINVLQLNNPDTESPKTFPKIPMNPIKFRIDESVPAKQIIRYSIPKAFERQVQDRLQRMEENDIIERADDVNCKLTCVSPLVLVPKGLTDFRIVVDYRDVNKSIIREPYPMPSLEKIWTNMPSETGKSLGEMLFLMFFFNNQ